MSKHIDLAERIAEDQGAWPGLLAIQAALDWLDRNPDQVPGRTMTASEMDRKCNIFGNEYLTGFTGAGGRVIPDPEPTNLEKLEVIVWDTGDISGSHALVIAKALDKAGVKAPSHD